MDSEKSDDNYCRYCSYSYQKKGCPCYDYEGAKVWWEACELAALVLPSSATVERVFSLLSNMWDSSQECVLSDALSLSLYLAFNKRA